MAFIEALPQVISLMENWHALLMIHPISFPSNFNSHRFHWSGCTDILDYNWQHPLVEPELTFICSEDKFDWYENKFCWRVFNERLLISKCNHYPGQQKTNPRSTHGWYILTHNTLLTWLVQPEHLYPQKISQACLRPVANPHQPKLIVA